MQYGVLIFSFVACYYNVFIWLEDKYSYRDTYYSHGFLIPFVSAYIIFLLRDEIRKTPLSTDKLGLVVITAALGIHILGVMSDINFISGFSIFFYILGCTLYLYGRPLTRTIAFPLCFLLFMFPLPNNFINMIGLPTKAIATDIGLMFIGWMDIPFYREGFRITLADTSLLVGTPCNGMKSLISFAAIGVLAIYFSALNLKKGFFLLLAVYPLSVGLNGLRIAILVYIADTYGIEYASPDSTLHDASGIVVFVIGIAIMFICVGILNQRHRSKIT